MSRHRKLIGAIIADRYCITGEIGSGGMGKVYRAIPFDDPSQNVAIKVILRDRRLNYEDLLRFQKEAALMSRLHHPNIISFQELGLIESGEIRGLSGGYYIVMEIAQGLDLKQVLKQGRQGLAFFFQLGLQVTSALEYTHSKNIIHRDIKPQNIIVGHSWHEDEQESSNLVVKVLDFGIAQLSEINQFYHGAKDVAGTPLYMAPETSAHISAVVDHRSDLYSLGCVLYEVLAGHPPFTASTREKIAREHAQTQPEPLTKIRPELPEYINDIVMKLLAKRPENRYQTAFGLQVDLQSARRCLEQGNDFFTESSQLGKFDHLRILTGSLDLVGRKNEFELLINNYNAISKGRGRSRLAIIQGGAGTGKSRLLMEFKSYLAKHKIRYISTSFSRHENNLPFNALANGFNEYLIKVYKTQQVEAEEIKRKVKAVLGPTVQLVAKVVPGLKPYLHAEEVQSQPQIESQDELERNLDFAAFTKAFSDFTRCLTSDNQPIVFVLDDMHWADKKSIELVDDFFSHNNSQRFYLVISYRSEEIHGYPEFEEFLRKFEKLRRRFTLMELKPLETDAVDQLTKLMLNTQQEFSEDFVAFLKNKTKGNPLYLVELVRSLVTKDFIRLNHQTNNWNFDLDLLKKSKILLDSIDLTLNRVNDYDSQDRAVLEIASLIGTSFNFEMLLIEDELQSITVMRALQRAMADYLIVRSPDVSDLKHLGKSFSFSHSQIRDSIRDAIPPARRAKLHTKIAQKLQELIPSPSTQVIFTLAHHFNQSLNTTINEAFPRDLSIVMLALKYCILAGEKALEMGALVSAERYFRNAYKIFPNIKDPEAVPTKKYILNKLGDILGLQKQYTTASRFYFELLNMELSKNEYASISYKLTYFSMLNGKVSETIHSLFKTYRTLNMIIPRLGIFDKFYFLFRLWGTVLFKRKSKVFRRFLTIHKALKKNRYDTREAFHPVRLYHLGQVISLNQDIKLALAHHIEAIKMCLSGYATPDAALKTFGDFAILLGYFGHRKLAYMYLDTILVSARELGFHQTFGYLLTQRTLTLDHWQGKFEDYDHNINTALNHITLEQNQQLVVQGILFQLYQSILSCNTRRARDLVRQLPIHLRTRHWYSPRGISMYLFSLLLQDAREQIVLHKGYLERREQVGARKTGIFISMIEAMINFASGNPRKAYDSYRAVLVYYSKGTNGFLYPYEEDFTQIFIMFFPTVMQYEYQFFHWNIKVVKDLLHHVATKSKSKNFAKRAVPSLVAARLEEVFGGNNVKQLYDRAMKASRFTRTALTELLTQLWFGRYLLQEKHFNRKEYIYQLHDHAKEFGLPLLQEMAVGLLQEFRFSIPQKSQKATTIEPAYQLGRLLSDTLNLTSKVFDQKMSHQEALSSELRLLRKWYNFKGVHIVLGEHLTQKKLRPFSSERRDAETYKRIIEYVRSYFTIRSTLFIPEGDASWGRDNGAALEQVDTPDDHSKKKSAAIDLELTQKLDDEGDLQATLVLEGTAANDDDQASQENDTTNHGRFAKLNTIIPVKNNDTNIGVILLEKVEISSHDSTQARNDLDYFGAYMGLWLRYAGMVNNTDAVLKYRYAPGHYFLEACSWMDIWPEGHLRSDRESTWYLGVGLSRSEYLIMYCRLNGVKSSREQLSSQLWYHMLAVRSLFVAKNKKEVSWEDIYEEVMKILNNNEQSKELEGIAISYSIFNESNKKIVSGHFGPSRPFVLGVNNEVTPLNRVILNMNHGRTLRFWRVVARNVYRGLYVQAHDSSKLESLNVEDLQRLNFFGGSSEHKRKTFSYYLKQLLVAGHVPRYFVAATFREFEEQFKPVDKAE